MSTDYKKPVVLVVRPENNEGQTDRLTLDRYLTPRNKKLLEEFAEVRIADVTVDNLHNVEAILSLNGLGAERITPDNLKASNTLKHVVTAHHWYIHADRVKPACDDAKVRFTDASYAIDDAVAGAVVSAMFQSRMGFYRHNHALRANPSDAWLDRNRGAGRAMGTAAVGLISMGNIGKTAAKILRDVAAFRPARVLAHSKSLTDDAARDLNVEKVGLEHLLEESDILSLHTRLTPGTRDMIGTAEFALMKPDAVFINMARGPLVNEEALVDKLKKYPTFIAVLDVFSTEPLTRPDHPLYNLPNTFVTPHAAAYNPDLLEHTTKNAITELKKLLS